MGNRQNRRLDPRQVRTAREKFSGQLRMTVAEIAAHLSGTKHDVEFAVVCRVLEASDWHGPSRMFSELEERHRDELRLLISDRGWKPERAAALYGLAMDDAQFVEWLSKIGAIDRPKPAPAPRDKKRTGKPEAPQRRRSPTRPDDATVRRSASSGRKTVVLNGAGNTPVDVRDDSGVLLVEEGGRPFWTRNLSEPELDAVGARFFPGLPSGYKRNRVVIQVIVGCRKNGTRANIGRFVSSQNRDAQESEVRAMVDWLRGSSPEN